MMGFGFLGLIFMLLFWVGLIVGAIFLMRALFPGSSQGSSGTQEPGGSAKRILDERYARGEITRAEYEAIKEDLFG